MKSRGTVLVVDDNDDLTDTVCMVLADEGYQAVPIANAEDALAALDQGLKPCLVLLDLVMPDRPGQVVLEHMWADPALRAIPVMLMSGAGPAALDQAREIHPGAEPLPKPFDVLHLIRYLERTSS